MKILTVFGTRPEAIKMAVLCQKLKEQPNIDLKICTTGQHREMLGQVMDFFGLQADIDLDIMRKGQDLTDITSRVLLGLRDLFKYYSPDLMLVHGDTTTSMAAAMAGFYAGIKVGHVEAGLRTGNIMSPFPEEANRNITSKFASYHFAPTKENKFNLEKEGITEHVYITGNTVIDALYFTKNKVSGFSSNIYDEKLKSIYNSNKNIILVTGHRRENFGEGFIDICKALSEIASRYPDIEIVYPVHLNPNVQKPVMELLSDISNICLTAPLDYPDFVYAMKKSHIILTDSGGVQEEAPSLGKPVLVMRDNTERPEALQAGTVKLVGAKCSKIVEGIVSLIEHPELYREMTKVHNPYGDGLASERIVETILRM